ncbi:MAG: type IV toxin-antitoxin system AbiEi family antitoxin domain-containing protein, partial [Mycobacterium sp.]
MLDAYLRRQDGVITLAQALHAGLSQDVVDRRVHAGAWRRCARGVYFVDNRPFTDSARIRASVWAHGEHAVAHGLTAAWWQGMTKFAPSIIEVTVRRDARLQHQAMTRLRRRDLSQSDIVERRGL